MLSKYQNENCIAVDNLRKQYSKDNTYAVDGITFDVKYGTVFGFLGPNGAGKTTTLKVLTTLLTPTSGSVRVLGWDVATQAQRVRAQIGFVFGGERGLYTRLSGRDNLRYFAELYAIPPRAAAARIDAVLALVGLQGRERERVERYSRGMRQRLHIP